MFHADVTCNAPKDRTLFNFNVVHDGWPKLREFLKLPSTGDDDKFPHENQSAQAQDFYKNLFNHTEYEAKVDNEVNDYFARNGYDVKKIQKQ